MIRTSEFCFGEPLIWHYQNGRVFEIGFQMQIYVPRIDFTWNMSNRRILNFPQNAISKWENGKNLVSQISVKNFREINFIMIFSKDDRPAWGGMDLDRDHWGDESNGPPPGAALPPGASTSSVSGGIHPHPNAVAPPGTQGSQLFGPNHQGVEPAAVQQRTSNGAPQPPQQGPSGGIGGSNVPPHIRQNGKQHKPCPWWADMGWWGHEAMRTNYVWALWEIQCGNLRKIIYHSDFTWNQFLELQALKCHTFFFAILKALNFDFGTFQSPLKSKIHQNQISWLLNQHFLTFRLPQNWFHVKSEW